MVIPVETTSAHPHRGFTKFEDDVTVTAKGFQICGDRARGWNRAAA